MKNIIKLIMLLVILVINLQSQTVKLNKELTTQEKQEYINRLTKDYNGMAYYKIIMDYKVVEAVPKIESIIWEIDKQIINIALFTLHRLDSPNVINLVNAVFDSINTAESQGKLYCSNVFLEPMLYQILFEREDFSRAEEYFSKLESPVSRKYGIVEVDYNDVDVMLTLLLSEQYKHRIKKHIENYIKSGSGTIRDARLLLYYYAKEYKEEAYQLIKESFSKYEDHEIRWWILEEILRPLKRIDWLDYYKQLFDNDQATSVRAQLASILVNDFRTINNVEFINQRWNSLSLELRKRINLRDDIETYFRIPSFPKFYYDITKEEEPAISAVLDTLVVYNNETRRVGWIKADSTRDKYSVYINNAKNHFNQNKQYDLKQEMIKLQAEVKKDTLTAINMLAHNWLNKSINFIIEKLKDVEEPIVIEKTAKQLLEELAAINQTNRTTGKYSADWVYTVLKSSIDNGLLMLSLNVPASSLIIMEQFTITATGYKNSSFINQEGYNLLKTKNDEVIVALKKLTN